jgi:hypothetical protein
MRLTTLTASAPGAITRDRAQPMRVGAHHVGQHVRVGRIACGTRHAEAVPIPGCLQRIDREHRVTGDDQRLHPRTPIGLNRDLAGHILDVIADLRIDHRVQPRNPRHPLLQPSLGQPAAGGVHQLNVVMLLSPIIPNEQHRISRPRRQSSAAARESSRPGPVTRERGTRRRPRKMES